MRGFVLILVALWAVSVGAQQTPYRGEFISYDIRGEADAGTMAGSKYYRELKFEQGSALVEIPALWLDRDIYVRDPNYSGRFSLAVNGEKADFEASVTHLLKEGDNLITLEGDGVSKGFFVWSQPRIHIHDWVVSGHYDEYVRDNVVDLEVVVVNGFNMPEKVTLGYDIYDPTGALKDYFAVEAEIPGRGADTIRFYNKVMGTQRFQYTSKNPALYRGVMTLRHNGRVEEYVPFRMGFGVAALWGPEALPKAVYITESQPKSVYDKYEREGTLIVDQAAIEGLPPNDPAMVSEVVDRQAVMFYRNRNRANVVGWSLGTPIGNGYNMYKAYQWMKRADSLRPVIYRGADGQWNTDDR